MGSLAFLRRAIYSEAGVLALVPVRFDCMDEGSSTVNSSGGRVPFPDQRDGYFYAPFPSGPEVVD